jgi:hypothetical protein
MTGCWRLRVDDLGMGVGLDVWCFVDAGLECSVDAANASPEPLR